MSGAQITIIVPTYNRSQFIAESLRSALEQDLPPDEIIVVDDGSTDDTASVVSAFGPRVAYLRKSNGGKSTAINLGLERARGDLILILDDDDLLPAGTLRAHVDALAAAPDAGFSYGSFARFRGRGALAHTSDDIERMPVHDDRRLAVKLMENCFLTNPTWMVRTAAQKAVGRYSEDLIRGQDFDMILRLARQFEGAPLDRIVLYQRKHRALRGSEASAFVAEDTVDRWVASDRLSFERYDSHWTMADFRPWDSSPDRARLVRLTTLQRAVVMFIRKAYARSEAHFACYREQLGDQDPQPSELRLCRNLLGSRYGIAELTCVDESHSRWLRRLDFPISVRSAFASHLRWRLREALRGGRFAEAIGLARFGLRAFGAPALSSLARTQRGRGQSH